VSPVIAVAAPRQRAPGALAAVLDAIARAALGDDSDTPVTLGAVTLRAHQRDALRRLRASVESVGGALLADEPGLGKTFVALALAREHPPAIVVAPAALRAMWRSAAAEAALDISFISMEALSRHELRPDACARRGGFMIVDEAHHVSNPHTARYARLARLAAYRRVLLLSATPVRNRRAELGALLALFMGPRAYTLGDTERSRCIVRRGDEASLRPTIDGPHWHRYRALPGIHDAIANLPPPLPALDGSEAAALLRMSLARCWASSLAALDTALRRRLQRGAALAGVLDAGRLPTRHELRAWVVGDDAVQLAFPIFAAQETPDAARLRATLTEHLDAVHALRARIRPRVDADALSRAALLCSLRASHSGAPIVAFTAHASTADALFRALRTVPGIALLTARGARTAGGPRPRAEIIGALGADAIHTPRSHAERIAHIRDNISLVITTDLLSEGVNLQGASVIVHLDLPWTPAGLDQRVGRAARMGSPHAVVHVHGITPPSAAERLLAIGKRLNKKRAEETAAARAARESELTRTLLLSWRDASHADPSRSDPLVATAHGATTGFIAVIKAHGEHALVGGMRTSSSHWQLSDAPANLYEIARGVRTHAARPDPALETAVRAALDRWVSGRQARESGGADEASSRARRLLLGRLDAVVRSASAFSRAALARRIIHVRMLVQHMVTAGAERILEELTRCADANIEAWLAMCESRLGGASPRAARDAGEPPAVRALLVLRGDP
jgi:superfamily II DNA or RNA helicase